MSAAPNSIAQELANARQQLEHLGDEALIEARVLLCESLQRNHAWIIAHADDAMPELERLQFHAFIERRLGGEPIAYIIGRREFWSLSLQVNPAVLIPRADSELLVERALQRIPSANPCSVCDLGTGSGAIALAIASERAHALITASDRSEQALQVARDNAQQFAAPRPNFILSNWFDALQGQRFDVIVSNPPYIRNNDPHLSRGDLRFEPLAALATGGDGLDDIRSIIEQAANYMNPAAWLLLEHGYDQGADVRALFNTHGFLQVETSLDLAGHERVTQGRVRAADEDLP